jgi:hypothetical protein
MCCITFFGPKKQLHLYYASNVELPNEIRKKKGKSKKKFNQDSNYRDKGIESIRKPILLVLSAINKHDTA